MHVCILCMCAYIGFRFTLLSRKPYSQQSDIREGTNQTIFNEQDEFLELFLLGKWLKRENLSKIIINIIQ